MHQAIDASAFYANPVHPSCRSWMNVPFTLAKPELEKMADVSGETATLEIISGEDQVLIIDEVIESRNLPTKVQMDFWEKYYSK